MKSRPLATALAILLTIAFIAPSAFFIAPQSAYALGLPVGVPTMEMPISPLSASTFLDTLKNTLTAWAQYADWLNKNVLMPLALIKSIGLMQSLTAGVIAFVDGQANGTGAPQFVQDLQGHLQNLGDVQAHAFFTQFNQNSNSPFASAITSSLQANYLQHTSLAGFFAENKNTLDQYSPNPTAFLAGDWSQGGTGAWFALTTQNQNNPYTFYQASQSELSTMVAGAVSARLSELNWGKGFLSWCGPLPSGGSASAGVPTDPCTQSNGQPGMTKTPGSVIAASLDKVLGSGQDKLAQLGNIGSNVNGILGSIATMMQTVNLAKMLTGTGSGGLAGGGNSASQYARSSNFALGAAQSSVYQNVASGIAGSSGMSDRITQYQAAWTTINTAATAASASVNDLINYCSAAGTSSQNASIISDAQAALANEIAPVFTQVAAASSTVAAAQAMVQKIQTELASGGTGSGTGGAYTADMQTLQAMPPTALDIANAQVQAQSSGVTASSTGSTSLSVTGYSLVDQMNLISANAQTLKSSCASGTASSTAP